MKRSLFTTATLLVVASFFMGYANKTAPFTTVAAAQSPYQLVGTWESDESTSRTQKHVELFLRGDGTYTKILAARVDGLPYGGTHDGTWTNQGMLVYLSGDGNWPATTEDLRNMQKVK